MAVRYEGGGTLKSFAVMAPALVASGTGKWRGENPIADQWSFEIDNTRFRENTGLSGTIRLANDDRMLVDLRGAQFDLRPFVEDETSPEPAEASDTQPSEKRNVIVNLTGGGFLLKGRSRCSMMARSPSGRIMKIAKSKSLPVS